MHEKIRTWVDRTTGGESLRQIARNIGVSHPTLSRQLTAAALDPYAVVAIARVYDADPLDGLVALGLITRREVRQGLRGLTLENASDQQLMDEVLRRLNERGTENLTDTEDPGLFVSPSGLTLLSGETIPGGLPYAADVERPGDDSGEDQ